VRLVWAALFVAAAALPSLCQAQPAWSPEKNVEIVIGAGPGAAADATARTIQRIMQERKLIPVSSVVVNKPGASYALSWVYLNQHQRDGHYLAITTLALLTNAISGANPLTYTDITPIAQLFTDYVVLAVRADSPIKTGKDLVERLRQNPTAASIAIAASLGNQNHIASALALKAGGVDVRKLKMVVFDSSANSVVAVLGGHVDVVAATALNIAPHVQTGKLRAIAVSSPQRLPGALAEVPTWTEQGYNAVFGNWRGVVGPKGLSQAQIAYWEQVFAKLVTTDEWKRDMDRNFWSDFYMGSRDSRAFLEKENATLRTLLTDLGLAK
jgi:putative tricarboxylic transport membrane protein